MKTILFVALLSATVVNAGGYFPYIASDLELVRLRNPGKKTIKPKTIQLVKRTSSLIYKEKDETIDQKIAEALTNTIIRVHTIKIRKTDIVGNGSIRKKTQRGNLSFSYYANIRNSSLAEEVCSMSLIRADGTPDIAWTTRSFQIDKNATGASEVNKMLKALQSHGLEVEEVSIAVQNQEKYQDAVSFLEELGIIDKALIGIDSTAKVAKVRISIKDNK